MLHKVSRKRLPKGFTLVELLIVIAILAMLAAAVVIVLNPGELLAQARDTQRTSDIRTLQDAMNMVLLDGQTPSIGTQGNVHLSLPSATAPACDAPNLPALPTGWSYRCVLPANLTRVDGTGWLPINFSTVRGGSPLPVLPLDPTNNSSFFYAYIPGTANVFAVSARRESIRFRREQQTGVFTTQFTAGSNPNLASIPSGGDWIRVPGDPAFGTSDFWVMKYEAKCVDASGTPLTSPTDGTWGTYHNGTTPCTSANNRFISSVQSGFPIAHISNNTAASYCASIGARLITNEEYMTIARNAERQGTNWTGGSVGSGQLFSGHNDAVPNNALTASTDSNSYAGTGNTAPSNQRRTHTLSNGEIIWDLSGNMWEHVMRTPANLQTTISTPSCNTGTGWQSCNFGTAVAPFVTSWTADVPRDRIAPSNTAWDFNQGTGRIHTNSGATGGTVFLRGGGWAYGLSAGLFATWLDWSGGTSWNTVGFRCAR